MEELLEFDDDTARRLEPLYLSGDVRRRRRIATEALLPREGDRVADIGCGPGFHVSELADSVGAMGSVIGVDASGAMLAVAAQRNVDRHNVEFAEADATDLPIENASVDRVVAVQVYEYVGDVGAALSEAFRVLRPGGRLVVIDIDWTTVSWHSTDPDRMTDVLTAWDEHLVHRSLPRLLAGLLSEVGFVDVITSGHAFVNTDAGPDAYSGLLIPLIADFVSDGDMPQDVVDEWRSDLGQLDAEDRYFFTVTKFCFTAIRPGG